MGQDPEGSHYSSHIRGEEVHEYSLPAVTMTVSRGQLHVQVA